MAVGPAVPGLRAVVGEEAAARRSLIRFRAGLHTCLRRRGDALFELVYAMPVM